MVDFFEELMFDLRKASPIKKVRGDLFEAVCQEYLKLSSEFQPFDITIERFEIWSKNSVEWIGSNQDLGIDFVITVKETNELIAVQCKFHENLESNLDYNAVTNLISHSSGRNGVQFTRLILMSNVYSSSRHLAHALEQHSVSFYNFDWFESVNTFLKSNNLVVPNTLQQLACLRKTKKVFSRYAPKPHQKIIIDQTIDYLTTKDRMIVSAACGTGKTFVGLTLLDNYISLGEMGVIFVPTLLLARQFIRFIYSQQDQEHIYKIAVLCSDATVTRDDSNELNLHASEVSSQILSTTNDIQKFCNNVFSKKLRRIIVATYQSAHKLKSYQEENEVDFAFGLYDEAHKTTTATGQAALSIEITKRVFMTATPRIVKTIEGEETNVFSMSDVDTYGEIAVSYPFRRAIEEKVLSNYKLEVLFAETEEEVRAINDVNFVVKDLKERLIDARSLVLSKLVADFKQQGKMAILYFNRISQSKKFVSACNEMLKNQYGLDEAIYHLDGTMSSSDRAHILKKVSENGGAVSNVSVLTEGVDVPDLAAVIFAEPRESKVDIVQAIGRVMRKSSKDEHKVGRIILPIAVEKGYSSAEEWLSKIDSLRSFKNTILALAESDSMVIESISKDLTAAGRERISLENFFSNQKDLLGDTIVLNTQYLDTSYTGWDEFQIENFWKRIQTQALRMKEFFWWERYGNFIRFVEENGRFPTRYKTASSEEQSLANWAFYNRREKNKLSPTQVEALKAVLQEKWETRKTLRDEGVWNEKFHLLQDFINSNQRFPFAKSSNPEEKQLGQWRNYQKTAYVQKKEFLTPERIKKLESLANWQWGGKYDSWIENYEALFSFINKEQKLPEVFEKSNSEEEAKLANWVMKQRNRKEEKSDSTKLSDQQVEMLEKIPGWTWRFSTKYKWNERLESIISFIVENRPSTVYELLQPDQQWLREQERKWEKLDAKQQEAVSSLNIWPLAEFISPVWLETYKNVLRWHVQNKNLNENYHHLKAMPDNFQIWLLKQERHAKDISKEKLDLLLQLPFYPYREALAEAKEQQHKTLVLKAQNIRNKDNWGNASKLSTKELQNRETEKRWTLAYQNLVNYANSTTELPLKKSDQNWLNNQVLQYTNLDLNKQERLDKLLTMKKFQNIKP